MTRRAAAAITAAALLAAAPLSAQALHGSAGLGVGWVRSVSHLGTTTEELSGTVVGGEGRLRLGHVMLDLGYREGSLVADSGSDTRDYADGHFLVLVTTVPGVVISGGAHARAFITNTGTQRWLFWTMRLRGEHPLIAPSLGGYLEVWRSLGANVNVSEEFERAAGGEVGLSLQVARSPFWGRVGYGIERAWLGTRRETVEALTFVVGFGRR